MAGADPRAGTESPRAGVRARPGARPSENAVYSYLSLLAGDLPPADRDPTAILARHTAAFDPRFRAISGATKPDDMRFDELFEREALSTWGRGPLTLVGDAAHPLLPHTGQGAAVSGGLGLIKGVPLSSTAL